MSTLHVASRSSKGRKDIADLLLAKGAIVNAKDKAGRTPLYTAADEGRKKIVVLLLARGADVNARNKPATLKSDQLHVENSSPT
jgi:cytohesin